MTKKNDYEEFLNALGESFAAARKRRRLTQAEFGSLTGRGQSAVGKMERGPVPNVPLRVIYEMGLALSIPLSELFKMTEQRLSLTSDSGEVSWQALSKSIEKLPKRKKESIAKIVDEILQMD